MPRIEGEGVKNVHLKMDFSSVFNDIKAHLEKAIGLDKKPQLEKVYFIRIGIK